MIPVLLNISGLKIYTFGVFLMLAFFWGCFLVWKTIRFSSYKEEDVFDGVFISLGIGLLVGRLAYVVIHFADFGLSLSKFIFINGYPGMSLYGAIIGAAIALYLYSITHKIHFMEVVDYVVPALFLAIAIGKLGSFFAGVEVGRKTPFILAVRYAGFDGYRHLVGFYEALLFFLGAYLAYKLLFQIRRNIFSVGSGLFFFCWYGAFVSLVTDFLKEIEPTIVPNLARSVILLTILLTTSVYFLYYFRSKIFRKFKK